MADTGQVTNTEKCLLGLTAVFLCALLTLYLRDTSTGGEAVQIRTERTVPQEELVPEYEPLDLNSATAGELTALPGIGPELAARIVAYREENGPFSAAEEILNVSGIGEIKFQGLEGRLPVDGEESK